MHLVFDWDGTLCDSTGRIVDAMQNAARARAVAVPTVAAVRNVIGLGLPEAMEALFPDLELAERDAMRVAYAHAYREIDLVPAALFEGVLDVLEQLRCAGHLLSIATGKGRPGLDRVLDGLGLIDYFDATRCADETRSKPHPMMLNELLVELRADPAQSLVIGDSEYDLMMARSAGVASVGVSYGVHEPERLWRQSPRAVVDHIAELVILLEE